MCAKEVGNVGTLGIPVTIPLEAPTRLGGIGGWTTRLAEDVVGMLDLGEPTEGGRTPSVGMAEVKMKELSPTLDIILPTGTSIMGGSKGRT